MTENKQVQEQVELPSGVTAQVSGSELTLQGPQGSVTRNLKDASVTLAVEGNMVNINAPRSRKKLRCTQRTFASHIRNMAKGVTEGFEYKLKVCSGHFPMNVSVSGDEFVVKNFIGEKVPRSFKVHPLAKIQVNGDDIVVTSIDKEVAGQTAASIETITSRTGFDSRIYQSGIFITHKDGKEM